MEKYENAILEFFKKQKDKTKCDYIFKVAREILDAKSISIELKDGRIYDWYYTDREEENYA